jgi:hypothetical protein
MDSPETPAVSPSPSEGSRATQRIKPSHLLVILLAEIAIGLAIIGVFPVASFAIFGDSHRSDASYRIEEFIFFGSIILVPTLINVVKYVTYNEKGDRIKSNDYQWAQLIVTLLYLALIIRAKS